MVTMVEIVMVVVPAKEHSDHSHAIYLMAHYKIILHIKSLTH